MSEEYPSEKLPLEPSEVEAAHRVLPKAEVSSDSRFSFINPNRAKFVIGEKIFHPNTLATLFEGVEPLRQDHGGEHQRTTGWTMDRSATTESGAQIHIRNMDVRHSRIEERPLGRTTERIATEVEHQNGVDISISYKTAEGKERLVGWFIPRRQFADTRAPKEDTDTPESIRILEQGKEALDLKPGDPDYERAIQEMGTFVNERLTWAPKTAEQAAA